jgi:hypothetical protein
MTVLACLCAYVVGLDTTDERISDVMNRSHEASRLMYKNHLRCTPHTEVDAALSSHDSLKERLKIVCVYDVIKDDNIENMTKETKNTSFVGVESLFRDLKANECILCQTSDYTSVSLLLKTPKKELLFIAQGKNECEYIIHRDLKIIHTAFLSMLRVQHSRVVCTRVSFR